MLVLSRKLGESIHIGDDIVVEVRRVAGNRVSLAFEAPKDIRILRGELQAFADGFGSQPNALSDGNPSEQRFEVRRNPLTAVTFHRHRG